MRWIVLDTGPLGLFTRSPRLPQVAAATAWLQRLLQAGARVAVPDIAEYEVRRELLRLAAHEPLQRLDRLVQVLPHLALTSATMRLAATLWADLRRQGQPTADPHALDGDVILAAQALHALQPGDTVIVATMNVGHLERLVPAALWHDITPE